MMLGGGLIERVNVRSTGVWKIPDNFAFEKAPLFPSIMERHGSLFTKEGIYNLARLY